MPFYNLMTRQPTMTSASSRERTRNAEIERQISNYAPMDSWRNLMGFSRDRMRGADSQLVGSRNQFMGAISNMANFDPMSAMRGQAQSIYGDMSRDFNSAEGQRRAAMNRRGMLSSSAGNARAQRGFQDAFSRAIAGLSMQGAQMRQSNLGNVASMYGGLHGSDTNQSNLFADMLYGSAASRISQNYAAQQASKDRRNNLWGAGISAVGDIVGGLL